MSLVAMGLLVACGKPQGSSTPTSSSSSAPSESSPYHIGEYVKENDSYVGDENGAFPWQQMNKNFNMYNVDEFGSFITQRLPF